MNALFNVLVFLIVVTLLALAAFRTNLFGCRHTHRTRPFTLDGVTYQRCLDCAKEIPYSLELMRPI